MRLIWRAIFALIPVCLLAPACVAQQVPPQDRGAYVNGTYQDSCTDAHWDGSVLYARCQTRDGGWRNTSIDSSNCGGQILNIDGSLRCGQPENGYQGYGRPYDQYPNQQYPNQGYGRPYDRDDNQQYGDNDDRRYRDQGNWQGGLPPGSYQLTCQDMRMNGDRLEARCQKRDGDWRGTHLKHVQDCINGIVNDNGKLRCVR